MAAEWDKALRSLIDAPSPAVLTTYRKDGNANVSPVWSRWNDDAFEVVIALGDVKLKRRRRLIRRLRSRSHRGSKSMTVALRECSGMSLEPMRRSRLERG